MLVIIGHSLADPDIREIANKAASLNAQMDNGGQIVLFVYTRDDERASLFEARGLTVSFGDIDEFFAGLTGKKSAMSHYRWQMTRWTDIQHLRQASDPRRSDVRAFWLVDSAGIPESALI